MAKPQKAQQPINKSEPLPERPERPIRYRKYENARDTNCHILGRNLRRIRKARGITQKDLAIKLDISPQQLYKYETGKSKIDVNKLNDLRRILQVPMDLLLFDAQDMQNSDATLRFIKEFNRLANPEFKEAIIKLMQQMNKQSGTFKLDNTENNQFKS